MLKKSILVVGSANTDMVIKLDRLPKPGETLLGGEFASLAGGKGANQAVGAARAGGDVTFIARLGRDVFGDAAIAGFKADGINVDYVMRDPNAPSGIALIFIGKDGENSIGVASGANANLMPADLMAAKAAFQRAGVVVVQLETPLNTVEAAAVLAAESGARLILNPAPACQLPDTLLQRTFVITPNQTEAELLTGVVVTDQHSAGVAAARLLTRGVRNVIVTMGACGALVVGESESEWIPAYKVEAADTTAAGDIFNGALAVALAQGKTLVDAARFATAAAAISVTRLGAQPSAPCREDIEQMLARGKQRVAVLC